jgi:hypothetical protein
MRDLLQPVLVEIYRNCFEYRCTHDYVYTDGWGDQHVPIVIITGKYRDGIPFKYVVPTHAGNSIDRCDTNEIMGELFRHSNNS